MEALSDIVDENSTNLEGKAEKLLLKAISKLEHDIDIMDAAIDSHDMNARKLANLMNAKQRVIKSVIYVVSLIRDPKRSVTAQSARLRDLARLIESIEQEELNNTAQPSQDPSLTTAEKNAATP